MKKSKTIRSRHKGTFAEVSTYRFSILRAVEYLEKNKIIYKKTDGFWYTIIEFANRTDMQIFMLIHQDFWEVINF